MRPALRSVGIQALGSAATVMTSVAITAWMGWAAQGYFGLLRTWNDALVALAVLGLPQGLLQLQYRDAVPPHVLRGWVLRYVMGVAGVLVVALLALWFFPAQDQLMIPWWVLAVLACGVPLSTAHMLWRALLLRTVGHVAYAALTAAPAGLLLVGAALVCALGAPHDLAWALCGSALGSAWLSGIVLRRGAAGAERDAGWSHKTLWAVGIENGIVNTLTALSPALLLSTLKLRGAALPEVGVATLGLHAYQLFAIAATYLSPMAYHRWASAAQPPSARQLWAQGCALARQHVRGSWVMGLMVTGGLAIVITRSTWPAQAQLQSTLLVMALAGAVALGVRVLSTLMLAHAALRPLTYQALLRLVCTCGGAALFMRFGSAPLAAALALLVTETVLLVWLCWVLRHR
jgi:hypothetical protein